MSASAKPDQEPVMNATGSSSGAPSGQDGGQALASSGSDRFVVWTETILGNSEVFFKRSTDGGATWQTTVNLSNDPADSFHPQIAVSGSHVYVIWTYFSSDGTDSSIVFRRSNDNGETWGSKKKLADTGTTFVSSPLVAASGSNVYVVWDDLGSVSAGDDIMFRRSIDGGTTWMPIKNLSDFSGNPVNQQIAISGSNVYVIWGTIGNDVVLRRSTDEGATWKAKVRLSGADSAYSPRIAASGPNVYVTWTDLVSDDVTLRRSTNYGGAWASAVNISNSAKGAFPEIAASGSNVYVAWYDESTGNGDVYFRRSANGGASWQSVKNLSNNAGGSSGPRIAISDSNVYVVWHDDTPGNTDIMFRKSTDNGATLGPKVRLSNNPGSSFGPQIDVSESNIFVAWNDFTPDNLEIFSRRSTDNGSTWKSVTNLSKTPTDSSLGGIVS